MNRSFLIYLSLTFLFLTSCFKEDEMVQPHIPGDVDTKTIALGQYYSFQVYFDLETGTNVSTNLKDNWDLGFNSSEDGWNIILNTSRFMMAANTGITDFNAVKDTSNLEWKFDKSTGDLDSTAIGQWINFSIMDTSYTGHVYILDLGINEMGVQLGYKKIVFEELKNNQYRFRYANLDGTEESSFSITKDFLVNYVCFSFKNGGEQLEIQPDKNGWDLLFTQYTDLLFTNAGEPYPYIVTGVLVNSNGVEAAFDTTMHFNEITKDHLVNFKFSSDQNKIGYEWKYYDFDNAVYTVFSDFNYIIKDVHGYYYKMRFIGFYNNLGEKGYPTIEYQKL